MKRKCVVRVVWISNYGVVPLGVDITAACCDENGEIPNSANYTLPTIAFYFVWVKGSTLLNFRPPENWNYHYPKTST